MPHIIAMSGGVDSSVALHLAKMRYGDALVGVTLTLADPANEALCAADARNVADAAAICAAEGIEHRAIDAHEAFSRAVIDYFTAEYLAGRTPNPCVVCNRAIKFGLLSDWAAANGFDKIITGHYARLREIDGYRYIRKAADPTKDQSYMLAQLTQEQLRRAEFPLGEHTKAEVRAIAEERGFVTARRRDSQDICFIPDGDYVRFISERLGIVPEPGDYTNKAGDMLGRHKGHWCYTIGQRKGLGISLGKHAFVLAKDASTNRVILGDEDALFQKEVRIAALHFPSAPNIFDENGCCTVKLRYSACEAPAVFRRDGDEDVGILTFDLPQRAPSPGQFAVLYKCSLVIASGVIVG